MVTHPIMYGRIIKQAARRRHLPERDARFIQVPENIQHQYKEFFPTQEEKSARGKLLIEPNESSEKFVFNGSESENSLLYEIRHKDQHEYLSYWRVANFVAFSDLLKERRILDEIREFSLNKAGRDDADLVTELEKIAPPLAMLDYELRFLLLGELVGDISLQLVIVSTDLRR
jgi:hypothetical protein